MAEHIKYPANRPREVKMTRRNFLGWVGGAAAAGFGGGLFFDEIKDAIKTAYKNSVKKENVQDHYPKDVPIKTDPYDDTKRSIFSYGELQRDECSEARKSLPDDYMFPCFDRGTHEDFVNQLSGKKDSGYYKTGDDVTLIDFKKYSDRIRKGLSSK